MRAGPQWHTEDKAVLKTTLPSVQESRTELLELIEAAENVTFVRAGGNLGDHLIHAGTRQLLAGVSYREVSSRHLDGVRGHTALLTGSGGWCQAYHRSMPSYLHFAAPALDYRVGTILATIVADDDLESIAWVRLPLERGDCFAERFCGVVHGNDYRNHWRRQPAHLRAPRPVVVSRAENTQVA